MRWCLTLAALVLAIALGAKPVHAQCGAKPSSCSACHDGGRAPRPAVSPWHEDHGIADVCSSCHGGRPEAQDVATAHEGLVAPLAAEDRCSTCHAADAATLRARYLETRKDPSRPKRTVLAPNPHGDKTRNLSVGALVAFIGIVGGLFVARREKQWSS